MGRRGPALIYFAIEPVQSLIGVKVGGAAKSSRLIGVMARTLILRPARLAPFVAAIGYHEGVLPPGRERVLPSGHTELMLNVVENEFRTYPGSTGESRRTSGAVIRGPSSRPAVIDTAEQRGVITVSFHPGGATAFVPASLSALADQTVDVAELWGSAGSVLREWVLEVGAPEQRLRRVEEALLERLDVGRAHWDAVAYAAAGLAHGVSVGELCRPAGLAAQPVRPHIPELRRPHTKEVREGPPLPAPTGCGVAGNAGRLGRARGRTRLLRPGPPDSRLPRVRRCDSDELSPKIAARP